jgi:hypothetical protein
MRGSIGTRAVALWPVASVVLTERAVLRLMRREHGSLHR